MKIQIIYSSRTGCTKKTAQAVYDRIRGEYDVSLCDLADGIPVLDGDVILAGYWGISGGPDEPVKEFLKSIRGKAVGIFCTLGYYADSAHAWDTVRAGVDLVKEHNLVIGSYVCNGSIARELMGDQAPSDSHVPTEQKEIRWEMIKDHPTDAECALAAERFAERIWMYKKCRDQKISFSSIL